MEATTKFKTATGTGCFVCATSTEEIAVTIFFNLDIEETIKLQKVVKENDIAMAAVFIDAHFYIGDNGGRPQVIPEEFEFLTNYEIEEVGEDVLDRAGWYPAEYARLEVHEDKWVLAVGINENTFVLSEDVCFEK